MATPPKMEVGSRLKAVGRSIKFTAYCILRTAYFLEIGAGDEGRTRDFDLGKVALYH